MYNKTTCILQSHSINEGNILARMKIRRKVKKIDTEKEKNKNKEKH